MSERDEGDGGAVLADGPTAAALAAVPGNDPVSASEVAAELDVSRSVARDALLELSGNDDLEPPGSTTATTPTPGSSSPTPDRTTKRVEPHRHATSSSLSKPSAPSRNGILADAVCMQSQFPDPVCL